MANKNIIIVNKLITYIDKILDYCELSDLDNFLSDVKLQESCAFNLLQMGELVNRIDDEFIVSNSLIPWNSIRGLRNRIAHDYEGIDFEIIWDLIMNDLTPLKIQLKSVKGSS